MALESATYIDGLIATNPLATDPRSEGDDHIRLLKAVLKATFPNIAGAVNATHNQLNHMNGVTSNVQTQIDTINTQKPRMDIGTSMIFYMPGAPAGWTQDTAPGLNHAIRIVGTAGASTGGNHGFTTAFAQHTVTGTVDYHELTISELPAHAHATEGFYVQGLDPAGAGFRVGGGSHSASTSSTGSGWGHNHPFYGGTLDLRVAYLNMILCARSS
jgi:hypothetical protein